MTTGKKPSRFDLPLLREKDYDAYICAKIALSKDAERSTWIADNVLDELIDATEMFPPMNSAHEGFAVLKEEVDELWEEVRAKQGARDIAKMRKEAVQVAAMAMRFILDVCDSERGQK